MKNACTVPAGGKYSASVGRRLRRVTVILKTGHASHSPARGGAAMKKDESKREEWESGFRIRALPNRFSAGKFSGYPLSCKEQGFSMAASSATSAIYIGDLLRQNKCPKGNPWGIYPDTFLLGESYVIFICSRACFPAVSLFMRRECRLHRDPLFRRW